MTITTEQIITLASVIGALTGIYALFSRPFKLLDQIDKSVTRMEKQVSLHGDMIAELLEHNIDGNNTGKMKEAKKRFDDEYRNNININMR